MANRDGLHEAGTIGRGGIASWPRDDQITLLSALLGFVQSDCQSHMLAEQLLKKFGSLPQVMSAPQSRLHEVEGVTPAIVGLLAVTMEAAQKLAKERIGDGRAVLTSWSQLQDYLYLSMAQLQVEQFRILFLDKRNRLIADEVQQTGTLDHTPVYTREVIKRSLEICASALILVHNHPSGDPSPSSADIRVTQEIETVGKPLGITVHDHVVIGRFGCASLRALGFVGRMP